jgi:hypothetical protein
MLPTRVTSLIPVEGAQCNRCAVLESGCQCHNAPLVPVKLQIQTQLEANDDVIRQGWAGASVVVAVQASHALDAQTKAAVVGGSGLCDCCSWYA